MKRMTAEEVSRRMHAIPEGVKKAVFAQQRANAEEIASTMRNVAVKRSGTLASTIRVEVEQRDGGEAVFVRAGGPRTTRGVLDYARFVEFGTKDTSAQPFFWPVVRLLRRSLRRKLNKAMRVASEKEFAG